MATKVGMDNVISLGAYRRRRAKANASKIARDALSVLGKTAFFLPGILVSFAFLCLRLTGVVHWPVGWIALPLLIDIGLWYANFRAIFVVYKLIERVWGPLKPFRGAPA